MKKYLLPVSLAIGVTFDILFWGKIPGISFPIFVCLGLSAGFFLIRSDGRVPVKINFLLLVPILFFSLMSVIRREPLTTFLNLSLTLFGMALLAVSYLNGLWISFSIVDYIANFFHLIGGMIALPWLQKDPANGEADDPGKRKKNFTPILRGLALSLPVWLVFIALLYSADLIFAERLDQILANLNLDNLVEFVVRAILVLLVAYLFSGVVLFAAQRSGKIRLVENTKPLVSLFLGMTETSVILSGVLLLFAVFVMLQFQYFFSGKANIHIEGFTYADYARRGFGELVAVAVLSILLVKGLSFISSRETEKDRRTFTILSVALVALVLVILVSAFQRLFLYESAYGFSRLRTYSHVFMVWLGVLLIAIALMEIFRQQKRFFIVVLAAAAGLSLTLNTLNVDQFIVRRNIGRTIEGEVLDAGYLSSLSTDAIPELVKTYISPGMPAEIQGRIGAALACFQQDYRNQSLAERPWQTFHLSDQSALKALESISKDLERYQLRDDNWPVIVTGPDGTEYPCQGYSEFD